MDFDTDSCPRERGGPVIIISGTRIGAGIDEETGDLRMTAQVQRCLAGIGARGWVLTIFEQGANRVGVAML